MATSTEKLKNIKVGDIINVFATGGARTYCLVQSVGQTTFHAKTMTTHLDLVFNRETGVGKRADGKTVWYVQSVAPFPEHLREVIFGYFEKRNPVTGNEYQKTRPEGHRLSQAEIEAHEYLDEYYASHPLADD